MSLSKNTFKKIVCLGLSASFLPGILVLGGLNKTYAGVEGKNDSVAISRVESANKRQKSTVALLVEQKELRQEIQGIQNQFQKTETKRLCIKEQRLQKRLIEVQEILRERQAKGVNLEKIVDYNLD